MPVKIMKLIFAGLLIALAAWLWWYRDVITVTAQSRILWSEPIQLSNPEVNAWAPAIATDMAGNVHVMWSQTMAAEPPPGEGDTLFYTRWDGEKWSTPVDVLVSPGGAAAEFPDLAVTPDGTLHAVWGTGGIYSQLMYAHAPACCADHPRNWSQPVSLGMPVNLTTALVADDRGRLHAAFASLETRNIVYRRSDDGGTTWPVWIEVAATRDLGDEVPAYPRLAVDGRGRVHMVWSVLPWPGRAVMYARSDDGGDNWNTPLVIDTADRKDYEEGYGPIFIDIEVHGEDEVHLIWDGAPTIERTHIWSSDGGDTWSRRKLLFPELSRVGRSGWNDMVMDSADTLHAVALEQPWYSSWSGGAWSRSTALVPIGHGGGAEWMRIALSLGNCLHVVWLDFSRPTSVRYVQGKTSAPMVAAQALPTVRPTPLPTPTLVATTVVTGDSVMKSPTPTLSVQAGLDSTVPSSPIYPILMAVIPALVVVSIVFAVSIWPTQRRGRG